MPRGLLHDCKDLLDVCVGNRLMEQVRHRVDENTPRLPPPQWHAETAGPIPKVEALRVRRARYATEPLGKSLCVAVGAPGRDLVTTSHWIPGGVGPLDRTLVTHV